MESHELQHVHGSRPAVRRHNQGKIPIGKIEQEDTQVLRFRRACDYHGSLTGPFPAPVNGLKQKFRPVGFAFTGIRKHFYKGNPDMIFKLQIPAVPDQFKIP